MKLTIGETELTVKNASSYINCSTEGDSKCRFNVQLESTEDSVEDLLYLKDLDSSTLILNDGESDITFSGYSLDNINANYSSENTFTLGFQKTIS